MTGFTKLVLILFGLAYLISPVDLIPDLLLPWLGWIDDGVILWSIYYLIRYGELPWFLFQKKSRGRFSGPQPNNGQKEQPSSGNQATGPKQQPASGRSTSGNRNNRSEQAGPTGSESPRSPNASKKRSPREILGVSSNASQEEIQRAYKKKIKQYHPDKLSHLGKEFADLANEKFLEIQAAYDSLMKK